MDPSKLFLYGLDFAGKTAMVLTMKHGQTIEATKPTLAFNIDTISFQNLEFKVWDAPGQLPFRQIWLKGYEKAKILVFVLDTAEDHRYIEAQAEFLKVITEPMTRGIPLIFCFHKMDLAKAVENLQKAKEFFKLQEIRGRRVCTLETTIMDVKTLGNLKTTLIDIIRGK